MKVQGLLGAIIAFGIAFTTSAVAATPQPHAPREYGRNPELMAQSVAYSSIMRERNPEVGIILDKLGLRHLHQLDPNKVYNLNLKTGAVTVLAVEQAEPSETVAPSTIDFGFASNTTEIRVAGDFIVGRARTIVTCPLAGQLAEVSGFMASTASRDPRGAGIRNGTLVQDNFLTSEAEVLFSIVKAARGARNPINRTAMETTHIGSCGDDLRMANLVSTWPPLRVGLVVDDTGSMGNELAGLKGALSNFIASQNQDPLAQRGVSYELVTFKDAPTLRLANTEDAGVAIAAVQALSASGGGDCPEDAIGGLNTSLAGMSADEDSDGAIVLVTDASPRGGGVEGVISAAQAAGVEVHVMLSGDCVGTASDSGEDPVFGIATESARTVFRRIAEETGGAYHFVPGATVAEYERVLGEIFRTAQAGGDNVPPVVTVSVTPEELWPVDHRLVPITPKVSATDNRDPNPRIELDGVTSNEPGDGPGDGATVPDILIGDDGVIYLRAERSGRGTGRVYTLTYRAIDSNGNVGFGSAEISVPHDQR